MRSFNQSGGLSDGLHQNNQINPFQEPHSQLTSQFKKEKTKGQTFFRKNRRILKKATCEAREKRKKQPQRAQRRRRGRKKKKFKNRPKIENLGFYPSNFCLWLPPLCQSGGPGWGSAQETREKISRECANYFEIPLHLWVMAVKFLRVLEI